jgi:hypothetical protein
MKICIEAHQKTNSNKKYLKIALQKILAIPHLEIDSKECTSTYKNNTCTCTWMASLQTKSALGSVLLP